VRPKKYRKNFIVTAGKIADKETHEEELATEDATDLGDFAADIAEQPLEDIKKKKLKKKYST
jgi:hypothetical protein